MPGFTCPERAGAATIDGQRDGTRLKPLADSTVAPPRSTAWEYSWRFPLIAIAWSGPCVIRHGELSHIRRERVSLNVAPQRALQRRS